MTARIAFLASPTPEAEAARRRLEAEVGPCPPAEADVLVALGGDGFMLQTLHRHGQLGVPVYGMKLGSVAFLMNQYRSEGLLERLEQARPTVLRPLEMEAVTEGGATIGSLAYNEVSLLRQTRQAAHIRIQLNRSDKLDQLVCDGVLVATPAGSTAYNLSAHGPIIPLGSGLLALTAISPFRPRRWRGALLPARARFVIDVRNPKKRPVSAVADFTEVRDVTRVEVWEDRSIALRLLFDPEHNLEERILKEQFIP